MCSPCMPTISVTWHDTSMCNPFSFKRMANGCAWGPLLIRRGRRLWCPSERSFSSTRLSVIVCSHDRSTVWVLTLRKHARIRPKAANTKVGMSADRSASTRISMARRCSSSGMSWSAWPDVPTAKKIRGPILRLMRGPLYIEMTYRLWYRSAVILCIPAGAHAGPLMPCWWIEHRTQTVRV